MPLLGLRILKIHSFPHFLLHAVVYLADILHIILFYCITDQVRVSSICVNFCRSYAPFGTYNTGNKKNTQFSALFSNILTYPAELEIKDTTESTTSASYLDLLLSIGRDGQLHTSIYDKRDDFNFHITNFPFLSSNIPSSPAYGVFISQLIRYARACSSYECFILRARRLSSKLLKQGYLVERLKSSFRKFYGRYGDLIVQYGVTLSRMLNDILTLDQQWLPYRSDFPPISWPLYRVWPPPNYEWFPWSICNGCG